MKTTELNVLVLDAGGRGHALYLAIEKSPLVARVLCTPGNGGIPPQNRRGVKDSDLDGIVQLAKDEKIDLVVIGPEGPLVNGLSDRLRKCGIAAFGPSMAAAQLEGSKWFMKRLCKDNNIPTAAWQSTDNFDVACRFINAWPGDVPPVIKADGLCGGKGVIVPNTRAEAIEAAHAMLVKKIFDEAGSRIIIEERLVGRECSVQCYSDSQYYRLLPSARDFKRARNGNLGKNTGGMASYSPVPDMSADTLHDIEQSIIIPTLCAMAAKGHPYHGLLYAGIMLTPKKANLLEINVRHGDPETQPVLARVESDIVEYMLACNIPGGLWNLGPLRVRAAAAAGTVLTSGGYPGTYETGKLIHGLENLPEDVSFIHAGTDRTPDGFVTTGGRVGAVVALAATVDEACRRSQAYAATISFENEYHRTDISSTT